MLLFAVVLFMAGCQTPERHVLSQSDSTPSGSVTLREGDVVKISFPGAPNLNTTQTVRRDGKLSLPFVGELKAVGMTPSELEKQVVLLYEPQLLVKSAVVTVESASFPVFVSGAVLRPGKVVSNRPLTALEAIMEAGGFDYAKANLKSVAVIRHEEGQVKRFTLNLKLTLQGKASGTFYLQPSDIIYVPEKLKFF